VLVRDEFLRELPSGLRQLREVARGMRTTLEGSPGAAVDVRERLHQVRDRMRQLQGNAAGHGLSAIDEPAREIDDVLVTILDPRREAQAEPWARVEEAFAHAISAVAELTEPVPGSQPSGAVASVIRQARVLVVDQDRDFVDLARENARDQLIEVVVATTAARALEVAHTIRLDAALIDALLEPAGASFDLASRLRASPGLEDLPIAFVSAGGDVHHHVAAARAGATLYLTKPLDGHALGAALGRLTAERDLEEPRVLVAGGDRSVAAATAAALRSAGLVVATLEDAKLVVGALDKSRPDLLLLCATPAVDGFELCRMLRMTLRWQGLPVVIAVAQPDALTWARALDAGCDDVVSSTMRPDELVPRLKVRMDRARWSIDGAGRDALTELWLRRRFAEEFSLRIAEARRHVRPLALAMLDLDEFKLTNDVHGHLAGDRVLVSLAKLLRTRFRSEDLRGRWGGEEFVLALSCQSPASSAPGLERLLGELRATEFHGDAGEIFHVTFSAGISGFPEDGDALDLLLKTADRRLYRAKRGGRAGVVSVG
jgi:diguanylate cyclase (GGDEF)-like protein